MRVISLSVFLLAVVAAGAETAIHSGIEAFRAGRYSEALPLLQKGPQTSEGKLYLALTEAALNDCPTALPALSELTLDHNAEPSRLAALALARCYSASGDTPHAATILRKAAERFPNDADILYLSAKTEMKAFNDATLAMFQRTPASYRVHQLSAEILELQNRYADAVAEYRQAINSSANAPDLHFRLGRAILLQSHEPVALAEAKQAFRAELAISPEDSAAEFQLGQIAATEGNAREAQAHYERALERSPKFVHAMVALAKLQTQAKQYGAAIALLQKAIALEPGNESAHYALLTADRNSGNMEGARAEKATLENLQKPAEGGEFANFLKKLGDKSGTTP